MEEQQPEREHLGWRASSAFPAKKRRHIDGVSNSSLVQLQAQLYRTQDHVKLRGEGAIDPSEKHVSRRTGFDPYAKTNSGVEARAARDKLQLKGTAADPNREEEVTAALERKALLYAKLSRGEVEDDQEAFEVDFFRKGHSLEQEQRLLSNGGAAVSGRARDVWGDADGDPDAGDMVSRDMQRERERRQWEEEEEARGALETAEQERKEAHRQAIRELSAETRQGRERAADSKHRKEAQVASKREQLKAQFLQKQLQKALAARGGGGRGGAARGGAPGGVGSGAGGG